MDCFLRADGQAEIAVMRVLAYTALQIPLSTDGMSFYTGNGLER